MKRNPRSAREALDPNRVISRRALFRAGAAAPMTAAVPLLSNPEAPQRVTTSEDSGVLDAQWRRTAAPNARILLKGGAIVSMDPTVGDFPTGDVLIEGKKIVGVAASGQLKVPTQALVIDAANAIII